MKKYLVTGGAGFIGSHLVDELLSDGFEVKVYDNFSTGMLENIEENRGSIHKHLTVIEGDIRDRDKLFEATKGIDGVFHLAALVSVPQSIQEPGISFDINSNGTQSVLDVARKCGVSRVVLASSAAVYGNCQNIPINEAEVTNPLSPYGLDKLIAEQLGSLYFSLYNLDVVCLRFFNVYGPRQPPTSPYSGVVSKFAEKASSKSRPTIFGTGNQERDFVYVKDVVNALRLSMNSSLSGFRIYNVGTGHPLTVNSLWDLFDKFAQAEVEPEYAPARVGDISKSVADISLIQKELNFQPSLSNENSFLETYKWSQRSRK